MAVVEQRLVGPLRNFTYLIADPVTREAAVVDPSFDARVWEELAKAQGYRIAWILNTHHHPDHIHDNGRLKGATGARIAAHQLSTVSKDHSLRDGDVIRLGEVEVRVLHTPGHTPDSVCFLVGGRAWTGDTLFVGDIGRVDLPDSDPEAMWDSLIHRVAKLPPGMAVLPGHDYGPTPTSTVEAERRTNPAFRLRDRKDFVRFVRSP